MKLFFFFLFFLPALFFSQSIADKSRYLIDSLILEDLNKKDLTLIDSCLNKYHDSNNDTAKVDAINTIIERTLSDEVWPKYNEWLYVYLKKEIENKTPYSTTKHFYASYGNTLSNQGVSYKISGNIIKSLDCYEEALTLFEKLKDSNSASVTMINIATLYNSQGETQKAISLFERSYAICKEYDNKFAMAAVLNNLGIIYSDKKESKKALKLFLEALDLSKSINNQKFIASSYGNMGGVYASYNQNDSALIYFYKALEIHKKNYFEYGIITVLNNIGKIELRKGNLKVTEDLFLEAFELSKKIDIPKLISISAKNLSDVYFKQKKYKESLEMYKLQAIMKDSISNSTIQKAVMMQEVKYAYQKEKAISELKNEKEKAIKKIKQERSDLIEENKARNIKNTFYFVGFALFIAIGFIAYIIYQLKKQKNQNETIEKQKNRLEKVHLDITDSINYAQIIQNSLLPSKEKLEETIPNSFAILKQKDTVGGDLYWVRKYNDTTMVACIDCIGHGVPGAFMTMLSRVLLREAATIKGLRDPSDILAQMNTAIEQIFSQSKLNALSVSIDMSIAVMNETKNTISFASAQRPIFVKLKKEHLITKIKGDRHSIGGYYDTNKKYNTHEYALSDVDVFYLFTDGYVDQFGGPNNKKLKIANFAQLLNTINTETIEEQKTKVRSFFNDWTGDNAQIDDVCVIGVRV